MKHFKIIYVILALVVGVSCSNNDEGDAQQVIFAGNWSGTYVGDDSGTWTASIDDEGTVQGEALSNDSDQPLPLEGRIDSSGDFRATLGSVQFGATFEGVFTQENASGTWENETYEISGTWTGTKD
ncbi:hypothetical protein [Flagellimonas crocea]|uniref:hypothetical protein n=1 Tax=Flagellimonas crocea TaxID=3067311 RepID=UPI00296FE104|nr:hypothetical protein [Muricauda sp. DH64]